MLPCGAAGALGLPISTGAPSACGASWLASLRPCFGCLHNLPTAAALCRDRLLALAARASSAAAALAAAPAPLAEGAVAFACKLFQLLSSLKEQQAVAECGSLMGMGEAVSGALALALVSSL